MSQESIIRNLLQGQEFDDPRLYDLLDKMITDFYKVYNQLYPPVSNRTLGSTGTELGTETVAGFTATIFTNNLRLNWLSLSGALNYEIRYQLGTSTDWDTATSLVFTTTLQADLNPLTIPLVYGNHTFLLKGINSSGVYSTDVASVTVNIPQIPAPSVTPTVIDNFVLLKWTVPASSLQIAYYNVYKNATLIGKMDGTFEAIFETVSGDFTYLVETVDIVGNVGTSSSITVTVNQPPDYELQDDRISDLSGTRSYVALYNNTLVAIVDTCGV